MSRSVECEHDIDCLTTEERYRAHWADDRWGREYRILCGCECEHCEEY